jgi:deoxyribonuclease IV
MSSLVIATPGVPLSTPKPGGTLEGIKHAHSMGIRAMEMEWVQMVPRNPDHVATIGELAKSLDFTLTVHAPFFINLNSDETEKIVASKKRILDALTMAQVAGAKSVCVHAAFYGTRKEESLDNVRRATDELLQHKQTLFPNVNLAYETMGKHSQFGTVEEVLTVSKEFDIYPCVDVSHLHARSNGGFNDTDSWNELFDQYEEALGKQSLKSMHLHLSGIAYTAKGERNHLPLEESDTDWRGYLSVLKKRGVGGVLVCESPTLEKDTMLIQKTYESL